MGIAACLFIPCLFYRLAIRATTSIDLTVLVLFVRVVISGDMSVFGVLGTNSCGRRTHQFVHVSVRAKTCHAAGVGK